MSEPVFDLVGLGQMLEKFVPFHNHFCPEQQKDAVSKSS
jgi:hypothetical protein